jgi:hypothetical protein
VIKGAQRDDFIKPRTVASECFFFVFALHAQPVVRRKKINSKQCPARSKRQTAGGGRLSSIFGLTLQLHSAGTHTPDGR